MDNNDTNHSGEDFSMSFNGMTLSLNSCTATFTSYEHVQQIFGMIESQIATMQMINGIMRMQNEGPIPSGQMIPNLEDDTFYLSMIGFVNNYKEICNLYKSDLTRINNGVMTAKYIVYQGDEPMGELSINRIAETVDQLKPEDFKVTSFDVIVDDGDEGIN